MKRLQIIFITFFLSLLLVMPAAADILQPDKKTDFTNKIDTFSTNLTDESGYTTEKELANVMGNIVKMILSLLGSIFIIYIFVAGNQWMQAAGNEEKIKKSKARIQSLIIGLLIILIAYALSSGFGGLLANALTIISK